MQHILTITDETFSTGIPRPTEWRERHAARAIVYDPATQTIALLHAQKYNYHKLPGGGVDEGEDIHTALAREIMEEVGCAITDIRELGIVEEWRNTPSLHQVSHCFTAVVSGKIGTPTFTESELEEGFRVVWISQEDALTQLESEQNKENIDAKFMNLRELTFLRAAAHHF